MGSTDLGLSHRFDWRFLLPRPRTGRFNHLIALGSSSDQVEQLRQLELAEYVTVGPPARAQGDLIAVLPGARVKPSVVSSWLLPGGSVYWVIDRRNPATLFWTPRRLQRALRAAGLNPVATYWTVPNHFAPRKYVPLDSAPAIRWYARSFLSSTLPFRLASTGLRLLARRPSWLSSMVPCFSVIAVAGPKTNAPPAPLASSPLSAAVADEATRVLMLTNARDAGSRAVVLPFPPGHRDPPIVLKMARADEFAAYTEREQALLTGLRAHLSSELRATIPEPLGVTREPGKYTSIIAAESFARGRSLQASTGEWGASNRRRIDDLHLASRWIAKFHRETMADQESWRPTDRSEWIEAPLAAYADTFELTPDEKRLFDATRAYARTLRGAPPVVYQHDDFGPWNIMRHGSELTVIDWESGGKVGPARLGPALCDLLYFVTYWYAAARRSYGTGSEMAAFTALFLDQRSTSALCLAAHHEIASYLEQLKLARTFVPLLLIYTWVEHANDQRKRQNVSHEQASGSPRAGNRFVPFIDLLCGTYERLFDST